jgi:hypothetical protein
MNTSLTHPRPAAHLLPEVPDTDRLRGRTYTELAEASTATGWLKSRVSAAWASAIHSGV